MARTKVQPVDLARVVPLLLERAAERALLKAADLSAAGIPKAQHAAAFAALCTAGLESTKAGVRVPLGAQLELLVAERRLVPLAQLGKLLRGATSREGKLAAEALVNAGGARLVLRGKVVALAAPTAATMPRDRLAALVRVAKQVASAAAKVAKHPTMSLLVDDVREQWLDFVGLPPPVPAPAHAAQQTLGDLVVRELGRHVQPSVGLSFVPDAMRALASHGLEALHRALLEASRTGRIELRPESGLGRLSQEDLALCPAGLQGTRLSWARLIGGAS